MMEPMEDEWRPPRTNNLMEMEAWKIEVNGEKTGDLSSLDKQANGTF